MLLLLGLAALWQGYATVLDNELMLPTFTTPSPPCGMRWPMGASWSARSIRSRC